MVSFASEIPAEGLCQRFLRIQFLSLRHTVTVEGGYWVLSSVIGLVEEHYFNLCVTSIRFYEE